MSLYACSRCGTVENTATGDYWDAKMHGRPPICSVCETGKWHGCFEKRHVSQTKFVTNAKGLLEPPGGWPKPGDPQCPECGGPHAAAQCDNMG